MRRHRQQLQVSTFPFLAVLLCAMGSLILLLLVIDRRAKVVARARALQAASRVADEDTQAAEARQAEWERRRNGLHEQTVEEDENVLAEVRAVQSQAEAVTQALRTKQAQTGERECRLRAEQARLVEWEEKLTVRRTELALAEKQREASQAELARLTVDLQRLEQTLADLKAARRRQQQMYSVVPYRGKHGDNRRPLYVECTAEGLVFHPDQFALRASTESSAEIRAEIERRLARSREETIALNQRPEETPYLLMLVRPEGITTYYRVLAALQGIKIDFGYEFIDRDWILDFSEEAIPARAQSRMVAARIEQEAGARHSPSNARETRAPVAEAAPLSHRGTTFGGGVATSQSGQAPPGLSTSGLPRNAYRGVNFGAGVLETPASEALSAGGERPSFQAGPVGTEYGSGRAPTPSARRTAPTPGLGVGSSISSTDAAGSRGPLEPAAGPGSGSGITMGHAVPIPADPTASLLGEPRLGNNAARSPSEVGESGPGGTPAGPPALRLSPAHASENSRTDDLQGSSAGGAARARRNETPEASGEPKAGSMSDSLARLAPRSVQSKTGRAVPPRAGLLNINRDWIIPIECKADALVISTSGQSIPLTEMATRENGSNALLEALQEIIVRRQATLRVGEPPYRPMIRFRVWPDGLRSYYAAYPALEALHVSMARENVDPEEVRPTSGGR